MYEYQSGPTGADAGLGLIPVLVMLAIYVFYGYCQSRIAKKAGHSDIAWWAYIPILNVFQLIKLAGRPGWWFLLCLVPFVNIVAFAVLWMDTAKNVQQSAVWGIAMLLPFINFVALAVLAFSTPPRRMPPPRPTDYTRPREPQQVG